MAETKDEAVVEGKAVGKFLTGSQILEAVDLKTEVVEVPEWGGNVVVTELMAHDRDAYEQSMWNDRGNGKLVSNRENVRARLVVRSLVSQDGARLFSDEEADALGAKSAAVIDRLFDVATRLSGMDQTDVEAEGKDSDPLHSADSN